MSPQLSYPLYLYVFSIKKYNPFLLELGLAVWLTLWLTLTNRMLWKWCYALQNLGFKRQLAASVFIWSALATMTGIPAQAPEQWETMWKEGLSLPSVLAEPTPSPLSGSEFHSLSKFWKTNKRTTQPTYRIVNNKPSLLLEATEFWRSMWHSNE